MTSRSTRVRLVVSLLATVAILAPLAWLWQASLVPNSYSVMGMGTLDYGGGPVGGHDHGSTARSVSDITVDDARKADVRVDLVATQQNLTIGGRSVPGYAINGRSPGPTITARQGQLVEVHLRNDSVKAGVTLHWHGYDVPAAMDGVAGVPQDEVPVGGEFTYRFVAHQVGTYWYHSHQVSHEQVIGGLFGILVVLPKTGASDVVDVVAAAHSYGGTKTINGAAGDLKLPAKPGQQVRVRVINTDNGPIETWADPPFRLLAIDGYAVNGPTDVTDHSVTVTAGGRADLGVRMPSDGRAVRVQGVEGHCRHSWRRRAPTPAATGNRPGSTELRKSHHTGHRPNTGRPAFRLLDWPPAGICAGPARPVVVHQWGPLSRGADVRGP
jgi:FtsP/CotA-like multicopper oxidase with cupredoxin domain